MRSYLVDEIKPGDMERLTTRLKDMNLAGALEDIFWLPLPRDLLSPEQAAHASECGPHCLALECGKEWVQMELLVRSLGKVRCSCVAYATPEQRLHMIGYLDALLAELDIAT